MDALMCGWVSVSDRMSAPAFPWFSVAMIGWAVGALGCQRPNGEHTPHRPDSAADNAAANLDSCQKLPVEAKAILDNADQLEVWSLHPEPPPGELKVEFHRCKVLGKTVVKNAGMRKRIVAALYQGVAESQGVAGCFKPRHGIRATAKGETVDLVVCFECLWMDVHVGEKRYPVWTSPSPESILDKVLLDAKVPLAPKPE